MSDKNYEKLLKVIKKVNPPSKVIYLGTMLSSSSVKIGALTLEKSNLYINDRLIYIKDTQEGLKEGDLVVLAKLNDEKFIILERVV